MARLITLVGLLGLAVVGSGLTQRCSAKGALAEGPLFTGHLSTQWHTMRPVEKGWIGGMVISAAAGPFGNPDNVELLEMKAATAPDDILVVACGRLQNGDQQGVFSATYDPATITSTGQAVYRLQDNVMNGKRSVETGNMSVSQVGAALILADCAYVGLL